MALKSLLKTIWSEIREDIFPTFKKLAFKAEFAIDLSPLEKKLLKLLDKIILSRY